MKKSKLIFLSSLIAMSASSCQQEKDEWISGIDPKKGAKDTTIRGTSYRHYGGMWYPIYAGMINPRAYSGATTSQISSPGFTPSKVATTSGHRSGSPIRSGGFGHSSHSFSSVGG